MLSSEKFNRLLSELGCKNKALAQYAHLDASLISRFRTGQRIPRDNSRQSTRLWEGLCSYINDHTLQEKIATKCGIPIDDNIFYDHLKAWLFDKSDHIEKTAEEKSESHKYFAEKLTTVMNLLGVSNKRLAQSVCVDASYISHFRNGLRTPSSKSNLLFRMCAYFYDRAVRLNTIRKLAGLINTTKPVVDDKDSFLPAFHDWFYDKTNVQSYCAADSLLNTIDNYTAANSHHFIPIETVLVKDASEDTSCHYHGNEGLRMAVLRFLGAIVTSGHQHTVKLYSSQQMNWLSEDREFAMKWSVLMQTVLHQQNRIKIIHHINRGLPEMFEAFEKWMPLYMSGRIDSYYSKAFGEKRFSHTLFVAPGKSAIHTSFVSGTQDSARYAYITDSEEIEYYESQFDALCNQSDPLVRIYTREDSHTFMSKLNEVNELSGELKRMLLCPSLATMPYELLESILLRNKADKETMRNVLALYRERKSWFDKALQNGSVTEYVVLSREEELVSGEIQVNLPQMFTDAVLTYTKEEYKEHIAAITKHMDTLDNYRFIPLPISPYKKIQIILKKDFGTMIIKNDTPKRAFWFSHPGMCHAFNEYFDTLSHIS